MKDSLDLVEKLIIFFFHLFSNGNYHVKTKMKDFFSASFVLATINEKCHSIMVALNILMIVATIICWQQS